VLDRRLRGLTGLASAKVHTFLITAKCFGKKNQKQDNKKSANLQRNKLNTNILNTTKKS
jgi:hypothetical protein